MAEKKEEHTLTVREAARMFELAGAARTERSIVNWCQAYVPRPDQRAEVARAIRSILQCSSHPAAQQRLKELVSHYTKSAPKLAAWMEENLPHGFTVFMLPAAHQKRLRTSNLNGSTWNSNAAPASPVSSPNETSLLRLITALLSETSDDWETGKIYLNMENQNPPSV